MASIEQHISELLYDHDCVIVPSLGGFLASNQDAFIGSGNSIFPPFRKIAFNVYLKKNDGLLANHLVEYENLSYQQAIQQIELFVNTCLSDMNDGKKVLLKNIGTLYFDREHNLQFEAAKNSNHLKESFGMDALQAMPIRRDQVKIPVRTITPKEIRPSQPAPKKVISKSLKKNHRPIGIIAIAAAALWFSFNVYLIAPKKYESASLVPFDSQSIALKISDTTKPAAGTPPVQAPVKVETVFVATTAAADTTTTANKVIAPEKKDSLSLSLSKSNHHYVIAGVFKIHENGLSLVKTLREQGFADANFVEANGRTYVFYEGFENQSDAAALNDSLKEKNLQGWIWNF